MSPATSVVGRGSGHVHFRDHQVACIADKVEESAFSDALG